MAKKVISLPGVHPNIRKALDHLDVARKYTRTKRGVFHCLDGDETKRFIHHFGPNPDFADHLRQKKDQGNWAERIRKAQERIEEESSSKDIQPSYIRLTSPDHSEVVINFWLITDAKLTISTTPGMSKAAGGEQTYTVLTIDHDTFMVVLEDPNQILEKMGIPPIPDSKSA
jgi:hypothetical protein